MNPLLVVDTPWLLYRSFFALPESITGIDGHPVGALLGSVNALLRVIEERTPRAVVICLGAEEAPYRVELFAGYHAARDPMPDALAWQFGACEELMSAFGWQVETAEELEADDLLGAYAEVETAAGGHTLILTGDRDLYQCVSESTDVLHLKGSEVDEVDVAEVRSRYGIEPSQVTDFIALRGDPSDGLPGAPGIGAKGAATLLSAHGSLEALLDLVGTPEKPKVAHDIKPRAASALRDNAALLRDFKSIASLQPVKVARPKDAATDLAGGAKAAARFEMGALAGRLEAAAEKR